MPVIIQPSPGGGSVTISDSAGVPAGGTTGQYLRKETNADYDTEWADSSGAAWGDVTGTLSAQTDLQAALDAKAATSHAHAISDVTGLQTALDGKQASGSYAAASHSHAISDVTDLHASLDDKLDDSQLDTDTTLAANSDTKIATQKAVKAYVDANAGGASTTQTDEQISGFIASPSDKSYTIALKMAHGGTITECTTKSVSGTCTATFKVNSTALGGTANSVSSSEQSQAHSSTNTFVAGDDIVLTVSSNSSCVDLSFTIKYTRVLA